MPRRYRYRQGVGMGDSQDITQIIADAANNAGIDPNLAIAVAVQESSLNPNVTNATSGAMGLFQLMPATAAALGVTNPYDPAQNAAGGCTYLAQMLAQFGGDTSKALAAYNWGPGNLQKAIAAYGPAWLQHAPAETQNYVSKILGGLGANPPALDVTGTAANLVGTAASVISDSAGNFFSNAASAAGSSFFGMPGPAWAWWGAVAVLGYYVLSDLID